MDRNQKEIAELTKKIQYLERNAQYNPDIQKQIYELTNKIYDLKDQKEKEINERRIANEFAAIKHSSLSIRRSTQNPPIEILVNVFLDGKHITPTPGDYLHFDKNLNLHKENNLLNQSEIRSLQSDYTHYAARSARLDSRLEEQYLDKILKASLSFEPQFYLALGKIKGLLDLTEFTQEYEGKHRSVERVEANIATLLRILFDKKEIEVNGQKCQIAQYSWEKNRFPPYGYQTSRIVPVNIAMVVGLNRYTLPTFPFTKLNELLHQDHRDEDEAFARSIHQVEKLIDDEIVDNKTFLKALQSYGTTLLDPKNINLNNHNNYLVKPDLFYSTLNAEDRYRKFVYEYLAYRFSIYHSFFKDDIWTIYSQLPFFVNRQKNSVLIKRLLLFAPTQKIKAELRHLFVEWTLNDVQTYQRMAQIQYYTQLTYLERMSFQLKHRLEFMRLAMNCVIIQVILKEAVRCAKLPRQKDKSIECLSQVAKSTLDKNWSASATFALMSFDQSYDCRRKEESTESSRLFEKIDEAGFKINGTTASDESEIEEIHIDHENIEDYAEEVEYWEDELNEQRSKENVRRYVSIHHELPPTLECVFTHIQKLQLAMYANDIQSLIKLWQEEQANSKKMQQGLQLKLQNDCVKVILEMLQNKTCTETVEKIYKEFKQVGAAFLKKADSADDAEMFHILDEKYDVWYAPLNELQAHQKETMAKYNKCVRDLGTRLLEIHADDSVYGRSINQLDYAIEAFQKINQVNPVHTAIAKIPQYCVQIKDYEKINRYLNVLYDLIENKVLRGIMWGADFKYVPPACEDPKAQHELIQQILNHEGDLLTHFSELEPSCVLQYAKFDLTNMATARMLYEYAKKLIREGKFVLGIEAVNLALLFKFEPGEPNALYNNCRALLSVLWKSTGKKIAAERIAHLEPGEYSRNQYLLYYGNKSDQIIADRVKHLLYSTTSINFVNDTVKTLLNIFPEIKIRSSDDDAVYLAAVTNYSCIQAAVGSETAETILSNVDLGRNELEKVLKYFPHNHVVSNVVAQIADGMRDSEYEDTFSFVAEAIVKHRKAKVRPTKDELKATNEADCGPVNIKESMEHLMKVDEKLEFAQHYIQTSAEEREDEWPNKLEGAAKGLSAIPNFFKMAVRSKDYPYVDGNYKIRVVVDLVLVTHELNADPKTCEEKYAAARDLYNILMKKS